MRRRRLLASVGLLAVPAAGCTDDADTGAGTDDVDMGAGTDDADTSSATPTASSQATIVRSWASSYFTLCGPTRDNAL